MQMPPPVPSASLLAHPSWRTLPSMRKTVALALVWAYTGWTAGSFAVWFVMAPQIIVPVAAVLSLFAFVVTRMPLWNSTVERATADEASSV